MSALLIDTHVLIWWRMKAPLTPEAAEAIASATRVWVSHLSIWEIVIKETAKKLRLLADPVEGARDSGFELLPIALAHLDDLRRLPLHHRDPFDRLLVAQARTEGLRLVSRDPRLAAYDVPLLWA